MNDANPCLDCGACCASYRVSFYWAEAVATGLGDAYYEKLNPVLACMRGTNQGDPRCSALRGTVGNAVACSVYDRRPSVCRHVLSGDAKCLAAREKYGLPALSPGEGDATPG